jgi:hypothetical protein
MIGVLETWDHLADDDRPGNVLNRMNASENIEIRCTITFTISAETRKYMLFKCQVAADLPVHTVMEGCRKWTRQPIQHLGYIQNGEALVASPFKWGIPRNSERPIFINIVLMPLEREHLRMPCGEFRVMRLYANKRSSEDTRT